MCRSPQGSANMSARWSFVALLVAGGTFASNELTPMTPVEKRPGRNLLTEVRTNLDSVHGCYLQPPNRELVQFSPEDLSDDKYRLENPIPLRECRVTIKDIDQNDAGIWELFYTMDDGVKKASQYYNVSVAPVVASEVEAVNAVPSVISVAEGSDVHVRLEKATPLHDSCALLGPTSSETLRDDQFVQTCGFIVKNVTLADAGTWAIQYGSVTRHEASIRVTINGRFKVLESELVWTKNLPLNVTIGPEDTVYCRIINPSGFVISEGFGRCNIVLDRVRSDHAGVWKATIGTVGRVLVDNHDFIVKVRSAAKAPVITSVVSEKPSVMLSCQVESEHEITACKFRDPSGKVLLVTQGVGEDRYSFHGTTVDLHSEVSSHGCGLRITNPAVEDLGLWRCAVETKEDTYYGFLTVLCPWAMRDPAVAEAVVLEPILTPEVDSLSGLEGDQVTLRCSVQAAIRYCYFRAQNGTVFNVSPVSPDWFEYAGAGLDGGECGVRFPALRAGDAGRWSCHVGFHNQSEPEQRAQIALQVEAEMYVDMWHHSSGHLVVRGLVHNQRPLDYCRFVRIDGAGFTSENVPFGYENHSVLATGHCEIRVRNANTLQPWLDLHPWTVVAKVAGQDLELARSTQQILNEPDEQLEQTERPIYIRPKGSNFATMWTFIMMASLSLFFLGLLLGPRRSREWTTSRASVVRNSFRNRIFKNQQPHKITPMPA